MSKFYTLTKVRKNDILLGENLGGFYLCQEKTKYIRGFTNQERYKQCRKFRISGLTLTEYAERAVKPFVVQRKVFQTSGSYAGATITTKLFSIIQTAVINNINVERYLNYVFENINKEPIENLLPYSKNIIEKLR